VLHLEFTIEPFVEGRPGPHVTEAIAAAESLGVSVEVGPFGSSCDVSHDRLPDVLAAIGREAFAHGATHVSLHVSDHDHGGHQQQDPAR
jgi:uncharacterized protein YqgV (UPF0045/DUF77 family)